MSRIIAVPILILVLMIQTIVVSNLTLLGGAADLMMLVIVSWALQDRVETAWEWAVLGGLLTGFVSALPMYVPVLGYMFVTLLARWIQKRVWQTPILALLFVTVVGTFFVNILTLVILQLGGSLIPFVEGVSLVVLPSTLLNLMVAFPVYLLLRDLARWIYPAEDEV